ncbi:MAG: hypothetical protein Q4F57_04175 [Weeksellaceae bacterium]|nr:hypothetical protein [Weeksellaceae bacterium]
MTYSTISGLVLTVLGLILFIVQKPDTEYKEFYIAAILGLGIGILIGGLMGFAQKRRTKTVQVTKTPHTGQTADTVVPREKNSSGLKF